MPGNSSENSENNNPSHNNDPSPSPSPSPTSPAAGSEDKSTDIRAAMIPSTPIETASASPSDTKDVPASPASCGPVGEPAASEDDKAVIDSSPSAIEADSTVPVHHEFICKDEFADCKTAADSSPSAIEADSTAPPHHEFICKNEFVDCKTAIDSSPSAIEADSTVPVQREFICKNDEFADCKTGQYTMDLSRKVISDHFGRNKACTRIIKDWPLFCRKHYQRATYNQALWQVRKVQLILRQFKIIEEQFPGTRYEVALKKSEEQRLNTFSRKVASGVATEEASTFVMPRENKHFEAPIDVLRELSMDLGHDKSLDEVEQTVHNILDMLENGETKQVPSIEFLPQIDTLGNPYTKATGGSPKAKSPKVKRIGKKGGIQKPPTPKKPGKSKA